MATTTARSTAPTAEPITRLHGAIAIIEFYHAAYNGPMRRQWALFLASAVPVLGAGCDRPQPPAPPPPVPSATAAKPQASASAPGPLRSARPAPARLVAIGDLHGDLDAARRVLRLAGAIDVKDAWIGGKLVVVQTGDAVDRGDDDRAILDLLERLKGEAAKAGGELIAMSGNHEIMNASFDFRYVTPGAFKTFGDVPPKNSETAAALAKLEPEARGRAAAFAPGGPYAAMIAKRPIIYRVGDTMFVHGGILPKHVTFGIDRINDETRAWLLGEQSTPPRPVTAEDGPLWTRMYSAAPGREECATLNETLTMLGAKRMVMGHTVQRNGISPACDGKAWRIDVGLAKFYAGPMQALAIEGDVVTVLKSEEPR
jgi:hypothetical protein